MTIDGKDTFHVMGGIWYISPDTSIVPFQSIEGVKTLTAPELLKKAGKVNLITLGMSGGLQNLPVKALHEINQFNDQAQPLGTDVIWLYGKWRQDPSFPGWNGFIEKVTAHQEYAQKSYVCHTTSTAFLPHCRSQPICLKCTLVPNGYVDTRARNEPY